MDRENKEIVYFSEWTPLDVVVSEKGNYGERLDR
jgi:hypothetical protein